MSMSVVGDECKEKVVGMTAHILVSTDPNNNEVSFQVCKILHE